MTLHAQVQQAIFAYYRAKNEGIDPEWSGAEAKALSELLKANPTATFEHWRTCLIGRYRSDVNHAERPRRWIGSLSSYRKPLNMYKVPKEIADGAVGNVTRERKRRSHRAIQEALPNLFGGAADGETDEVDGFLLSEPGSGRGHGKVLEGRLDRRDHQARAIGSC